MRRSLQTILFVLIFSCGSLEASAGSLDFFEASEGPGLTLSIAPPASDFPLDIDYAPSSAEGGGFYGFSELTIFSTGDVVLTPTGFACQAFSCLYSPSPFTGGQSIRMTAADDLAGEFSGIFDLLTFSVTGTLGHVVLLRGEYLDATGIAGAVGNVQTVDLTILATVPEPGFAVALSLGCLVLASLRRFHPARFPR